MSVSSVSHRAAPLPAQPQARQPVKAATQETHVARHPAREKSAPAHAEPTYSHAKEKQAHTSPAKGQRVDIKA